ncbi:MAG: hypothetical protein J6J42_03735 [Lachnospiraceae bacterium]|nr:hypothetical protein [Lachnospiraceae bacterium]
MIISLKDIYKMTGMLIVSFCAVLVCAMFLNYYLDLIQVEEQLITEMARTFFNALCSTSKVVSIVSGGLPASDNRGSALLLYWTLY